MVFSTPLYNLEIEDEELWMLMGDFIFYRYAENRNRPVGILLTLLSLMISLATLVLLSYLSKEEVTLG
jgi:hypothetical protein